MRTTWRDIGDGIAATYARSAWRLPVFLFLSTVLFLGPLYLVRGLRLVLLALAGGLGLLGAAIAFSHPFASLCLSMFFFFSGLADYVPHSGILVIGLLLIAVARAVFDLLEGGRWELGTLSFGISLGALLAAAIASFVVVRVPGHALEQLWKVILGLGMYFALSRHADSPRRMVTVVLAISAGIGVATLVVLHGLLSLGGAELLALASGARFGGIHGDPNVQTVYTNCCVPVVLYALGSLRGWSRVGIAVLLLFLIATVVLSQSRAGMLLMGGLLVLSLLRARRARGYALVGIFTVTVIALLLPPVYWVRFQSIAQFRGIVVDRSLQLRQHVLAGNWHNLLQHPWFGVGLGNVGDNAPRFMLGQFVAHNSFLEVAVGIGVVGGLAYIALVASGWHMTRLAARAWKRSGRSADREFAGALGMAFLAFVLGVFTLSMPFYPILWVLLGLANAARRASRWEAGAG